MSDAFRIVLFPGRPTALLVVTRDGFDGTLTVPPLPAPFIQEEIAAALEGVAKVSVDHPKRFGEAIARAQGALREEARAAALAAQAAQQAESLTRRAENRAESLRRQVTAAALARSSNDPLERRRGELLAERIELEAQIIALKESMRGAEPEGRAIFEEELGRLRARDTEVMKAIAALREEKRARNLAAKAEDRGFVDRLLVAAKRMLPAEMYEALILAAQPDEEDEGSEGAEEVRAA
jgi:hypothetical protein